MKLNRQFQEPGDLPATLPLFPLTGALLLPRRPIQLTVFEPRYLSMLDDALTGERLIGMIQPTAGEAATGATPELFPIGCAGRIVQYAEIGDGRCFLTLMGVARFQVAEELTYAYALPDRAARLSQLRRRFHRRARPGRRRSRWRWSPRSRTTPKRMA